ncbi:MAG: carbohydrate kinase family protein [Mycobacteriales bacterium]
MTSIAVVGNVQADVLVRPVIDLPAPGTDVLVEDIAVRAAGSAGNTALALRGLGSPARLFGNLGDDRFGQLVMAELAEHGLATDLLVEPATRTGVSVCLEAPGRDRSFWTYWGCLVDLRADQVPAWAFAADLAIYCGYFTLPATRGAPTVGLLERSNGTTFFDCGWDLDGWSAPTRAELEPVLAAADVFLPNEAEAVGLTGAADPYQATRELQRRYGGWVVTKLGADGCCAAGPGGEWHVRPAPAVEVVDTTGAGDAFNAGLLHGLAATGDWSRALGTAVEVASDIISRPSHLRFPAPVTP